MQVLQEVFGLEEDTHWTVASGFGGGVGRYQSICGALSAGTMVLGMLEGRAACDPNVKPGDSVRPKVRRLLEGFRQEFDHIDCRDLVAPFDFNAPGGQDAFKKSGLRREKCVRYVEYVVGTMASEAR